MASLGHLHFPFFKRLRFVLREPFKRRLSSKGNFRNVLLSIKN